jgi:CheY-like chemotaxis protein
MGVAPMDAIDAYPLESRGTVLVVEDDHDIRVSVRTALEDDGFKVFTVTNGRSALDLLLRMTDLPCLILLDLMLPVMDGWHFAAILQQEPRLSRIPILIMSAYESPPPPEAAVGFVKKPVDADTLLSAIERYCP